MDFVIMLLYSLNKTWMFSNTDILRLHVVNIHFYSCSLNNINIAAPEYNRYRPIVWNSLTLPEHQLLQRDPRLVHMIFSKSNILLSDFILNHQFLLHHGDMDDANPYNGKIHRSDPLEQVLNPYRGDAYVELLWYRNACYRRGVEQEWINYIDVYLRPHNRLTPERRLEYLIFLEERGF